MNAPETVKGNAPKYYQFAREEIEPFIPDGAARILDVGCGAGRFGAYVKNKRAGVFVCGVEPELVAAKEAQNALDEVLHCRFEDGIDLPKDAFDVVVFNDSLEHFPETSAPLELARKILKSGGWLVLSIPNVRHVDNLRHLLIDLDWRYEAEGVRDNTHLRFFTKRSAIRTLEEAGFRVLQVKGINLHGWIGWKIRLLMRLFPNHLSDIRWLQFAIVAKKDDR